MNLPPPTNPDSKLIQIIKACIKLITLCIKYLALAVLAAVVFYIGLFVVKPVWECLLLVLKAIGEI